LQRQFRIVENLVTTLKISEQFIQGILKLLFFQLRTHEARRFFQQIVILNLIYFTNFII